ncbi:glycosyl transferase family 28 [Flaviaesturariibacter flavus]|uniref:Glycosyl transferase family 28 n=1 Tax=Flaviaesturariibacter flavus TaxID=2502780 RepID=A0A4R1BID7_9BACT|nr:glycosyltransferase [Flaviaesturariibacter flavus]TCJ17033.1 glycosyl transferase family 28 [Flaviaesturariibacter flavus]
MSCRPAPAGPRILVAALDWGLGHATRCIPIVHRLLSRGATVLLAGSGASGGVLREAFPNLSYHELPGHEIRYARSAGGLMWKILQQLPRLARTTKAERRWLARFVQQQGIDAVISDNRYGLHHPGLATVFITHQLGIRTPLGSVGNNLLRRYHYRLIGRFGACWVPDGPAPGLSGLLGHPGPLPTVPTRYIGPLSRFQKAEAATLFDLAVVLSGPEPQRGIWEAQLLQQLTNFPGKVLLVRGQPRDKTSVTSGNLTRVGHLPAAELQAALAGAALVLARCGYSTVMDLAALGKRSILVPTPGQTEQEYLARHLTESGFACCLPQKDFSLQQALATAGRFSYHLPTASGHQHLDEAIDELLARLEVNREA